MKIKSVFVVLLALGMNFMYAQSTGSGQLYEKPTNGDLQGTVYSNTTFSALKVNGEEHKAKVRYNALEDKMEFNDNLFYAFQPGDELNFTDIRKKYVLADYKDAKGNSFNGYLVEVQSGKKVKLYKKEKIIFVKGNVSKTGYDKTIPDKYVKQKDEFFLKIDEGEIAGFPSSKKNFSKLFGDKEKEVADYLKKNNYSLSTENDLKIVVNFLNTTL